MLNFQEKKNKFNILFFIKDANILYKNFFWCLV